jgi:hypothetical protein
MDLKNRNLLIYEIEWSINSVFCERTKNSSTTENPFSNNNPIVQNFLKHNEENISYHSTSMWNSNLHIWFVHSLLTNY